MNAGGGTIGNNYYAWPANNSTTLAHFGINACLLTRLPLSIFGQIYEF
jgi:hypothetical protein